MRAEADGLLARVRELPDDDGPRLIYADWLDEQGDPRGGFIRAQLALARLPEHDRRRPELLRAERELLARHGAIWAAPFRGLAAGPTFRRGFVEEVKVTARQFLARAPALFAAGPVRHLHLLDVGSHLDAVLASPHLARLTALTIYAQHLGEPLARAVAGSPSLGSLRELHLGRNRVGATGVERIAASPVLANLEHLDLAENELGEPAARALAASPRLEALKRLELGGNAVGPGGAAAVAGSDRLPKLERLGVGSNLLGPRLAPAPGIGALARVAELDLSANRLTAAEVQAIFADPARSAVRELDLAGNELGDAGAEVIAGHPALAGLRSLRLSANGITDAGLAALARSEHLIRLTALDLTNNPVGDDGFRALMDSRHLRHLRRLAYSDPAVSLRLRRELGMRYNRDLTG